MMQSATAHRRLCRPGPETGSDTGPDPRGIRADDRSVDHDAADRFARMHHVETLVDLVELERMGDHRVDLDLAVHVPVDDLWHIRAPARATEGGAFPDAAGNQLEGAGGDLGTGRGHADDDRFAPALMRGFERCAHHADIAGGIEGVIAAAAGQRHEMRDQIALDFGRIDEIGHAEAGGHLDLAGVEIDADDLIGPRKAQALDHVEADAAKPEDDGAAADFHLRGVDDGPDAGGDAAADIADLVERRV